MERRSQSVSHRGKSSGWWPWSNPDSDHGKHSDWLLSGWWMAASDSLMFSLLLSLCVVIAFIAAFVYIRRLFCARRSKTMTHILPTLTHSDVMRRSVTMGMLGANNDDSNQRRSMLLHEPRTRTAQHQTHNRAASFSIAPPSNNYYR